MIASIQRWAGSFKLVVAGAVLGLAATLGCAAWEEARMPNRSYKLYYGPDETDPSWEWVEGKGEICLNGDHYVPDSEGQINVVFPKMPRVQFKSPYTKAFPLSMVSIAGLLGWSVIHVGRKQRGQQTKSQSQQPGS